MTDALLSLLGLAVLHLGGAVLLRLASPSQRLKGTLRSPSSAWAALAVLYALSLGVSGLALLLAVAMTAFLLRDEQARPPTARFPFALLAVLALVVLARPLVPTCWDEFVWLAKARLESLGFGAAARAALDPAQHVIPAGYPSLWPAAVGWLSLGRDALGAHVLSGSLLVLLAAAAALEAWRPRIPAPQSRLQQALTVSAALAAPLVLVHLRSTYVDLPVGLLGLALLGHLLDGAERPSQRPPALAAALAVALVAIKDDGLAHVLAASAAALLAAPARSRASWRLLLPAALGLVAVGVWRALLQLHGVQNSDHGLSAVEWSFVPRLLQLFALHATDVFSWGVFWAVTLAALLLVPRDQARERALRAMVLLNLALMAAALLSAPERVRVFAENGTLVNRLLLQLWPAAATAVLLRLRAYASPAAVRAP